MVRPRRHRTSLQPNVDRVSGSVLQIRREDDDLLMGQYSLYVIQHPLDSDRRSFSDDCDHSLLLEVI